MFSAHFAFTILLTMGMHGRLYQGSHSCTQLEVIIFTWASLTLLLIKKVVFAEEELLHKKVKNKEVYVDYDTMTDFTEDDAVKKYGDLTALT